MTLSPDDPFIQNYQPIPINTDLSPDLNSLGITVHAGDGPVKYWIDSADQMWKELGFHSVETGGAIEVWPHNTGLTEDEADILREYAVDAFIHKPTVESGWARGVDGAWHSSVSIPVDENDTAAARIAAAHANIMRVAHKRRTPAA
ncbi:hypothetical protein [Nocardia sp. NPDC060249]|uniref:hypothetical protein n=1 Tax=Nocardia sp. NPDC060249 TaxID=3347082 RepID=UPI003650A324